MFEEEITLIAAAGLLRRYHDSLDGFVSPPDARWRFVAPGTHEVICHNDWSPGNAVFRGHVPIVMLDWDSAGPGSRHWDLASSAFWWVPLDPWIEPPSLADKAARFALFCDAYGAGTAKLDVLDTLIELLPAQADVIQAGADAGDPGFAKLAAWNVPAVLREDADRLARQRGALCGTT
jgi:aminoglycoside phosphotransferase (APT) family kinase protein